MRLNCPISRRKIHTKRKNIAIVCYSVPPLTYWRTSFLTRVRVLPSPDPNDRTTLTATNHQLNIFTVSPLLRLSLPLTHIQLATRHFTYMRAGNSPINSYHSSESDVVSEDADDASIVNNICSYCTKLPKVREIAHNILVRPQLEYASPIWNLF